MTSVVPPIVVAPPAAGTVQPGALTGLPLLRLSAAGPAVRSLQGALRSAGVTVALDGRFGPRTRAAVVTFQQRARLTPDGIVGPATWRALDRAGGGPVGGGSTPTSGQRPADRPNLALGASGEPVRALQTGLRRAGHATAVDGRFGPGTQRQVQAFQRSRGLVADGVVGAATWAALDRGATAPAPRPAAPSPALSQTWRTFGSRDRAVAAGDTWASIGARTGNSAAAVAGANKRSTSSRPVPGSIVQVRGTWRCPVPGIFINDWGFVRSGGRRHQGTDIFAPRGRPIVAPVGGQVVQTANGLGGNAIQLYGDDGNRYYFAHLDRYGAKGRVAAGTLIGTVGNSGNAVTTVTHLHFEIHPGGGAAVNPYPTLLLACK